MNNFFSGNVDALTNIERGLEKIEEIRSDRFQLKKQILQERRKFMDLQNAYLDLKKEMKEREEEQLKILQQADKMVSLEA